MAYTPIKDTSVGAIAALNRERRRLDQAKRNIKLTGGELPGSRVEAGTLTTAQVASGAFETPAGAQAKVDELAATLGALAELDNVGLSNLDNTIIVSSVIVAALLGLSRFMQCGVVTCNVTANTDTAITFPVAFPAGANVVVISTPHSNVAGVTTETVSTSTTGAVIRKSTGGGEAYWIAMAQ